MSTIKSRTRWSAIVLMILGVCLALSGQLLLTTNRNIPRGFAVCGVLFVVAGATALLQRRSL